MRTNENREATFQKTPGILAFALLLCLAGCAGHIDLPAESYEGRLDVGREAYRNGDYASALKDFEPLAEQGDPNAQGMLGVMYAMGQGVTRNYRTAVFWSRKAAELIVISFRFR